MKYRYEEVAEGMMQNINQGLWKIGDKLPGEIELSRQFGVARSTIREALNLLLENGVVEKRNGIGTFILNNKKRIEETMISLVSIGDMIKRTGYSEGSINEEISCEVPSESIRGKLNLSEDEKVIIVKSIRRIEDKAVACTYSIFPEKLVGEVFTNKIEDNIFEILNSRIQVSIDYALTQIKGINPCSEWDKYVLNVLKDSVVLMEQLYYDPFNRPIFFSMDYVRTDYIRLNFRRDRVR